MTLTTTAATSPAPATTDMDDMTEDHISFLRTVLAFHNYKRQATAARDLRFTNFLKLHNKHKNLLCIDMDKMYAQYCECIEANSKFCEAICAASADLFESYWPNGTTVTMTQVPPPTPLDMDKVFSTLRQFVRDWST